MVLPFKYAAVDVLANILAANRRDKPDIWAEREVHLDEADSLHPVVVAIWDSGTDTSVFPTQFSRNENDDRVLAWTWSGDRVAGPLRDVVLKPEEIAESKRFTKGSNDMRYNIDSREASAFRKHLSALTKGDVKRFLENVQFYLEYAHGTHVAGIALRGNSWMHPLIVRIDWPYQLIRPTPTLEWAEKYAGVIRETIAFFKSHGARVANLSWSWYTPKEIEHDLESNAQGASPEERRATARRLFDLVSRAFYEAIAGAPDILFVTAAGNTNSDVRFDEAIPSCFDLPNIISVGAVDQAGDETAFTSLGKVDVYANGCEIESLVPGGETQTWSGTSQAAPQVTALAGKLLAKYPRLTTLQLRQLILDGANLKTLCGDREIRLLNPRRSFELAATKP